MPAIRNRPRVDVVVRVPKARPWSESDDAWTSAAAGAAEGVVKGKVGEEEGGAAVGGSGSALSGGGPSGTLAESSRSTASTTTSTADPLTAGISASAGSAAVAGPSTIPSSSSSASSAALPPPPKTRPAETSCAEWNSLLIWARRMRGPQWDSSVGMWMVDQGSEEYYSFSSDPTQSIHSGGPSNTIPALPPHVQDHESSGLSSGSSTRPTTATAAALSQSQQQQHDQQGHLLAPPPPPRPGLQHDEHSSYASSSHSGSAPTSLDSKAVPLLPGSQQQQPHLFGQTFGGQQRRASPRW